MFGQAPNQVAHVLGLRGIQAVGGFVENQQPRLVDDGLGDSHALLVAPRKGADGVEGAVRQIGGGQHLAQRLAAFPNPAQASHVVQIVRHRHLRIHRAVLRQIAKALLHLLRRFRDFHPVHDGAPAARLQIAGEHLHDGRLASAVVPQQTNDLAPADREADRIDRQRLAVAPRQALRVDHRTHMPRTLLLFVRLAQRFERLGCSPPVPLQRAACPEAARNIQRHWATF